MGKRATLSLLHQMDLSSHLAALFLPFLLAVFALLVDVLVVVFRAKVDAFVALETSSGAVVRLPSVAFCCPPAAASSCLEMMSRGAATMVDLGGGAVMEVRGVVSEEDRRLHEPEHRLVPGLDLSRPLARLWMVSMFDRRRDPVRASMMPNCRGGHQNRQYLVGLRAWYRRQIL